MQQHEYQLERQMLCQDRAAVQALPHQESCTSIACLVQNAQRWLVEQPAVHWVAPQPKVRAHNFFATGISQCSAAAGISDANMAAGPSGDSDTHPFWWAGIDGTGQIVGMGDTGIGA